MNFVLHGGRGKTLFVTGTSVRIVQEHQQERHDKALLLRHVTAVEVKKPGAFDGFIQFTIAGGVPHDHSASLTGGAFDAARDENSVTFTDQDSYDLALKIKLHVESWTPPAGGSTADEIRKLKGLADDGVITAEQFAAGTRRLLEG
jgi:hypothetical protein